MEEQILSANATAFRHREKTPEIRLPRLGFLAKESTDYYNILNNSRNNTQDTDLLLECDVDFYLQNLVVPWCRQGGRLVVAAADRTPANLARLRAHYGDGIHIWPIARRRLLRALEARFAATIMERATYDLEKRFPEFSARRRVTPAQIGVGIGIVLGVPVAFWVAPAAACLVLSLVCAAAFVANALFRAVLVWMGAGNYPAPHAVPVRDEDLPLYSIIVPLCREAEVLPGLAAALSALDYPADRIEVLLTVEADDAETVAAAERAAGDPRFVVLHVPPGQPRTKPKAANYALAFVRGEFTVVYDAEDRPNPHDLLRHAGAGGFLGFQLFIGGTFATGLANPLLWMLCLGSWALGVEPGIGLAWSSFAGVSFAALILGNTLFAYLLILGASRRGWLELAPYGLTAPAYWGLISAACYRGLWHLLTRPMYWDKTRHGATRMAWRPIGEGHPHSDGDRRCGQ